MTTITVSDDTRVKVVRRKDEVLTSQDKVIRDLLKRAETTPVIPLNGSCSQCEEYRKELEDMQINTVSLQRFEHMKQECDNGIEIENKLRDEIKVLQDELAVTKEDIKALESVSDVVVLDEDNEILG